MAFFKISGVLYYSGAKEQFRIGAHSTPGWGEAAGWKVERNEGQLVEKIRSIDLTFQIFDLEIKSQSANTTATEIEEYGAMPEMIDDFIRNYFANMGLYKTLGSFQEEWFELEHKGLTRGKVVKVPSVYQENQEMLREKTRLKNELDILNKSLDKTRFDNITVKR